MPTSITVLAVADEPSPVLYDYFDRERWRGIDLVLSCGDLDPDYLDFLCTTLGVPVLYVRGNHDGRYEEERYAGCRNVHGRIVEACGLRIAGFEGCRRYNGGPCQYSEESMRRMVRRARWQSLYKGRPDIILTHAPPAGCGDGTDPCHRGFEAFHAAIAAWHPAYLIHGHMHAYAGHRQDRLNGTTVINAYPYAVFEIRT